MSDPGTAVGIEWLLDKTWAIVVGILGWMGLRQVKRIDKLEEVKVDREEMNGVVSRQDRDLQNLIQEFRDGVNRADQRGERIHERIDELTTTLLRNHGQQ